MWRDAAARGIYPFDFNGREQRYWVVVPPSIPRTVEELPLPVREKVVVQLAAADFTSGFVTRTQVDAALPL